MSIGLMQMHWISLYYSIYIKRYDTKYASQQQSYPRLDFLWVHPQQHGNRPRREDDSANDMNQAIGD